MANLAWVVEELGDIERGRELHEENLRRARALGNRRLEAYALAQLGFVARSEGRLDEAVSMLRQSIRMTHGMEDRLELAINFGRLAAFLSDQGRWEAAAKLLAASKSLSEQLGVTDPWWAQRRNEETLAAIHAHLDDDEFDRVWDEGGRLTVDQAVALALET